MDMLTLGRAVPIEEMPRLLQERVREKPPSITVEEIRALDPEERAEVLAVVERALAHFRKQALAYRRSNNPDERIANQLASFLEAARQ
jgi:hypothetical protein